MAARWPVLVMMMVASAGAWLAFRPQGAPAAPQRSPAPSSPAGLTWPWLPGGALTPTPHFLGLPFPVTSVQDQNLPQGQEALVRPGSQGVQFVGVQQAVTISSPSPAVVAKGTAVVHTLNVGGHQYRYTRVLVMVATAYNGSYAMNGPWGAVSAWNGQPLRQGDVAVDPGVIPLGTPLYVDGYGPALADDTGSAIYGDRIDLFFNESAAQIAAFGVKTVKVYELVPGS